MEVAPGAGGISAWQLLVTSATPTIVLCLLGAVGAAMSYKGVLDGAGCQALAQMCFFVFLPALIFSKIAQAVSIGSIAQLWPLLANMTVSILLGLALGVIFARILRTPLEFRTHVLVAVAFSNVGNMPLIFVSTLCHDKKSLFYRTLGANCEHLGVAYTAFDIAAATLWQFTVAINLIRRGKAAVDAAAALDGAALTSCGMAAGGGLAGSPQLPVKRGLQKMLTLSDLLRGWHGSPAGSGRSSPRDQELLPAVQHQHQQHQQHQQLNSSPAAPNPLASQPPGSQQQQKQTLLLELQPAPPAAQQSPPGRLAGWKQQPASCGSIQNVLADDDTAALLPGTADDKRRSSGAADGGTGPDAKWGGDWPARSCQSAWQYLRAVDWGALFPLPSQAAILGIVCGCIPAVKGLLLGPHPPLRMLSEGFDALGAGLIPTAIPLLGAVLYRAAGRGSLLPLRVALGVLCTKLVLQPALMTLLVVAALALHLFTPPDPMFLLTLLLSNATPTAINMQTLMVLYQHGESEMSAILFWQYLASVLTLPAYMWLFLRIIAAYSG